MYKRQPDGPANKVKLMQLIHNVVACIIRQSVAQVFKIADLFQDLTFSRNLKTSLTNILLVTPFFSRYRKYDNTIDFDIRN